MELTPTPLGGYRELAPGYSPTASAVQEAINASKQKEVWSSDNYIENLVNRANNGDETALDFLTRYWADKESEKSARDWTSMREDSAYQRLNDDLKKAGISPYVLSGATPSVSSSSGKSYSGTDYVSNRNNDAKNNADTVQRVLMVLGMIATAFIYAL